MKDMKKTIDERPAWLRVTCVVVVVLIVLMIVATLICALAGAPGNVVLALLMCDIIVPIFVWVFLRITKKSIDRRKEADEYYENQN